MSPSVPSLLVRSIRVLLVVLILVGVFMEVAHRLRTGNAPEGWLEIEMASSAEEVQAILYRPVLEGTKDVCSPAAGTPVCRCPACRNLRADLLYDFVFIPAYGLLFIALGLLLFRHEALGWGLNVALGSLAVFFALSTMSLDLLENVRLYQLMDTPVGEAAAFELHAGHVREASSLKWTFSFLTSLVLSGVFFFRTGRRFWHVVPLTGLVYLVVSVAGLAGVVTGSVPVLEASFTGALLAALLALFVFSRFGPVFEA